MSHNADYEAKQLEKLVGGNIVEVFTDPDHEFFGLDIRKGNKLYKVWIDSDQEGNSCGAVKIEE